MRASKTICFRTASLKHKETNNGDSGSSSPQQQASRQPYKVVLHSNKPYKVGKAREHAPMAPGNHANNAGPDAVVADPAMGAASIDDSAHGSGVVGGG